MSFQKKQHILACISDAPHSERVLEIAKEEADAYNSAFSAILIEDSSYKKLSLEKRRAIKQNIRYAESLGATFETLAGEDIAATIVEYAKLNGITQIVLDRATYKPFGFLIHSTIPEKVSKLLPDVDIHIIPDHSIRRMQQSNIVPETNKRAINRHSLQVLGVLLLVTAIAFVLQSFGLHENVIIPVYSLGILVACMISPSWLYSIPATLLALLVYSYFFAEPYNNFSVSQPGTWLTYLILVISSTLIGSLSSSLRQHSHKSTRSAYQEKILFDTSAQLQDAKSRDELITIMMNQAALLTHKNIVYYKYSDDKLEKRMEQSVLSSFKPDPAVLDKELPLVIKAKETESTTGATTLGDKTSEYLYIPCLSNGAVMGVFGIQLKDDVLDPLENVIIRSIISRAALAGENLVLSQKMEEAKTKALNQELKANLLRALSHDIRTPLTSISGNLDNLIQNETTFSLEQRSAIHQDAFANTQWLINMVENLLTASRLEDGSIEIRANVEILDDILEESLHHFSLSTTSHPIQVVPSDDMLVVNADSQLILRVLNNIISNAIEYTPDGTPITLRSYEKDGYAWVEIADEGNGISESYKDQLFEMFYLADQVKDARRSMGLGLYLCRKIIESHNGTITFRENDPHGCIFAFSLPLADLSNLLPH